jgi:hypothetical protein
MHEPNREDDKSIADSDRLFRRVSVNQLVWVDGRPRPSTGVFKTDKLSINIESLMAAQNRPPEDTLGLYPGQYLVAVVAGEVRKFPYPIVKDCDPPNDPAHGLILGKKTDGFAKAMVKTLTWIVAPSKPIST